MKKKLIFALALVAVFTCLLAFSVSAETPQYYIEFDVKLAGESDYTTVYVKNPEVGNPRINLTFDFYTDIEFTQAVDKSQIVAMDFSGAVHYGNNKDYVDRFTTADPSVYPLCEEITWFSRKFTEAPSNIFKDWTQLKRFNFGCLTVIDYGFLANTGLVEVTVPASVTKVNNGIFANCASLKSVIIEGGITSMGTGMFQNCTALTYVDLGTTNVSNTSMFAGCTALVSIETPYIKKYSQEMFKGCSSLTTVTVSSELTEIGRYVFSNCTALSSLSDGSITQEGAIFLPEGVTSIGQEAFCNCDSIKYLSLPSTVTYLGPSIIRDSGALEFVDFNHNTNAINFDNWGHFNNCPSLKAVAFSDGIKLLNNRVMNSCGNLQAVYLPANLEQMNTNGNGQGPFCYNNKMYFVQESFEVRDGDGYFFGDSFVMPEKPEIYYMPSTLSKAGGNVNSGTWFRDCFALNNTIVMPEAFTESTVVQMFREVAKNSGPKNVVYLGHITSYAWSECNRNINFVFANPANTDISTINFISFYNRNNENSYFYFCSTGYKYTMAKASVEEIAATLEENSYCHVAEKTMGKDATCTLPKMVADFCFCGQYIPGTETTEGDALGHSNTVILGYVYENYMADGYCSRQCDRCGEVSNEDKIDALFTSLGISAKTFGDGIGLTQGYALNRAAISAYADNTEGFDFGVLAYANLGGTAVAPKPGDDKVVNIVFDNMANDYIDVMVSGIPDGHKDTALVLCIYVKDKGGFYYLNDGNTTEAVVGNSYNEIVG